MFATRRPGTKWYNRGEAASPDFTQATLTKDNAWHTLSLAAIVPAGMKWVRLHLQAGFTVINQQFSIRPTGQTTTNNGAQLYTQTVGQQIHYETTIPLSTALEIDYLLSNVAWTTANLTIMAYGK